MRILSILSFFCLLFIGCNPKSVIVPIANDALDSLDYIVISTALEDFFITPKTLSHRYQSSKDPLTGKDWSLTKEDINMLVLLDSTTIWMDSISHYTHLEHSEVDSTDYNLTEGIITLNQTRYKIDNSRISSFPSELISQAELNPLLDSVLYYGYNKLYEKYPGAYGIVRISKPSYSTDGNKAMVYIGFRRGPKHGEGNYIWLKREGDEWISYDIVFLWES